MLFVLFYIAGENAVLTPSHMSRDMISLCNGTPRTLLVASEARQNAMHRPHPWHTCCIETIVRAAEANGAAMLACEYPVTEPLMVADPFVLSSVSAVRGYPALDEYGIIGDCRTAALVADDASIDWCCLPHFDSDAVLSRVISAPLGGYLAITPLLRETAPTPISQRYDGDTAILRTEIALPGGRLRITDFMPTPHLRKPGLWPEEDPCIVRRIEALDGETPFAVRFKVGLDYCRAPARMTINDDGVMVTGGQGTVVLTFADGRPCHGVIEHEAQGPFVSICSVRPGSPVTLALSWAPNPFQASRLRRTLRRDWEPELEATRQYWERWSAETEYDGPYRMMVHRSAITLKLLTFAPTGAMVAAPTTSLPESIGGGRNWDYRYTWIRDASFAAGALAALGHMDEAAAFIHWVEHRERLSDRELRVLYGIRGERHLPEMEIAPLEGYRQSGPVRVGNSAIEQKQIDIYGEWLDCVARLYLRPDAPEPGQWLWALIDASVTYLCDHWMEPDAGIWEVRSAQQNFAYSKVMCWAGVDRGIRLAERFNWPVDLDRWRRVRDIISQDILDHAIDPVNNAFAISYESSGLDAATLMIPIVGLLPPDDPRVIATTNEIQRYLTDPEGFVYRYLHFDDGVGGEEGTFVMCSYWLVETLAMQGRCAEATRLFEKLLSHASSTGLLSEMIDSHTGQLLGNYPQAFSHLGLIRAALALRTAECR